MLQSEEVTHTNTRLFYESGKSPAETAQEEVMEETGYKVDVNDLKFVSSFRSGVGVSGSLQYLFFCEVR
jgi:UDP-sugar diphosphatase